jgi:hypothetical protein
VSCKQSTIYTEILDCKAGALLLTRRSEDATPSRGTLKEVCTSAKHFLRTLKEVCTPAKHFLRTLKEVCTPAKYFLRTLKEVCIPAKHFLRTLKEVCTSAKHFQRTQVYDRSSGKKLPAGRSSVPATVFIQYLRINLAVLF